MAGTLALVVGPSGAGKDTLIAAARTALAGDPRFVFARRLVTREAIAAVEDHDSISRETFEADRARGAYALAWEAHGLGYGLPAHIDADIAAGRVVVANTSRKLVAEARARYPDLHVMLIDADPVVRAARLGSRGREEAGDIAAARLAREGSSLPHGVPVTRIDNSGSLDVGVAAFVAALEALAG